MREIVIVPSERQAEALRLDGHLAESRAAFFSKLLLRWAKRTLARRSQQTLAATWAISECADLFGQGPRDLPTVERLLQTFREFSDRFGSLPSLARLAKKHQALAMPTLLLERYLRHLHDSHLECPYFVSSELADRASDLEPLELMQSFGSNQVVARDWLAFSRGDLLFWSNVERKLGHFGRARFELPQLEQVLDSERAADPFERLLFDAEQTGLILVVPYTVPDSLGGLYRGATSAPKVVVSFTEARGLSEEVEAVSGSIRAQIEAGTPPEHIGVVCTDSLAHDALFGAFDQDGVPFEHTQRLTDSLLFRSLEGLLSDDALSSTFWVDALRKGSWSLFETLSLDLRRSLVESLLRTPLSGVGPALPELLTTTFSSERGLVPEDLATRFRNFVENVSQVRMASKTTERAALALPLLADLEEPRLAFSTEEAHSYLGWRALHDRFREDEALVAITHALQTLSFPLLQGATIPSGGESVAEFLSLLRMEVGQADVSAKRFAPGVRLGSLSRLRHLNLTHLFFVDSEGLFGKGRSLVPLVNAPGYFRRNLDEREQDRAWCELALASCRIPSLHFFTHAPANEFEEPHESAFLPFWRKKSVPIDKARHRLLEPLAQRDRRLYSLSQTRSSEGRLRKREAFHFRLNDSPDNVSLSDPRLAEIFRNAAGLGDRPVSVTRFENITRCHFRAFASNVLRVRDQDDPSEALSAREVGALLHRSLESAFRATSELFSSSPRRIEELESAGMSAIRGAIEEAARGSLIRSLEAEKTAAAAEYLFHQAVMDPAWRPTWFERSFGGPEDELGSLRVHLGPFTVTLTGQIDRIDRSADGKALRVVDYKSSLASTKRAVDQTTFQLRFYSAAARSASPEMQVANPIYLAANYEPPLEVKLSETQYELRIAEHLQTFVQGDTRPIPTLESDCEYCPYRLACRKVPFDLEAEAPIEEGR